MPEIPPDLITASISAFAKLAGKSERQVRKDINQDKKYDSVIDGGRNMVIIDSYRAYLARLLEEQQGTPVKARNTANRARRRGRYSDDEGPTYPAIERLREEQQGTPTRTRDTTNMGRRWGRGSNDGPTYPEAA